MSEDLNLRSIPFQSNLRSKPVRDNFTDVQNNFNLLRSEFQASVASTASEVTNARDNLPAVEDNIHLREQFAGYNVTGGIVTAQSIPDNTIRVSAGEGLVGGIGVDFLSATSNTISSPSTNRFDIVAINTDNTLSVELGATGTDMTLPSLSGTQRPLYLISQDTAAPLTIENTDLTDIRRQGAVANGKWFFDIQSAVDYISEGEIIIRPGRYYESVDLSGKSNITLRFENGAILYRPTAADYCIKSINTVSNETTGIKIYGGDLRGNGKAGAIELLKFEYTDEFIIDGMRFDSNASSTATYKNFVLNQVDNFKINNNIVLDSSGDIDYTTSDISNASNYMEDGYYKNQVSFCGVDTEKAQMLKQGWVELTAAADKFLRIQSAATTTGGSDTVNFQHSHTVNSHNHQWYNQDGTQTTNDETYDSGGSARDLTAIAYGGAGSELAMTVSSKTTATQFMEDSYTDNQSPGTDNQLSSTQDNRPAYYSLIALIHR